MERFLAWWKKDNRILTFCKAVLVALLPIVCCMVHCAMQDRGIGEVYLPASEWNDELFYFKQTEGIIKFGYPQGYFGFNESHALKLSFAAWSPVLLSPWILWGIIFGWNFLSPIICNIVLLTAAVFCFVWLARPTWKQLGVLTLLFCLYTPFVRYMLSGMPEITCFSLLILFYGLAVNYLERERSYKLALLFVVSGFLVLMRPYMLLFLLFPAFLWVRKSKWRGFLGSVAVIGAVLGCYALIKHYLGAEYFAPLFFTDWITAFFEKGIVGGIRNFFSTLYWMGKGFLSNVVEGFRSGLAAGAFFGGYLVMMAVLLWQSIADFAKLRRLNREQAAGLALNDKNTAVKTLVLEGDGAENNGIEKDKAKENGIEKAEAEENGIEKDRAKENGIEKAEAENNGIEKDRAKENDIEKIGTEENEKAKTGIKGDRDSKDKRREMLRKKVLIEGHLAFCYVGMLFALLLMYKLTEGSKHLLTFIAAGIFVVSLMDTRTYKKAVLVGAVFAYLYSYKAVEPYDYQIPFVTQEDLAQQKEWKLIFDREIIFEKEDVPNFDNVVIWMFNDEVDGKNINTKWQLLYALPEGVGISCCEKDYVTDHIGELHSRYIAMPTGGEVDALCQDAGYRELGRDKDMVVYVLEK